MKRYCFALDLIDDQNLIKEYEDWHQNIWPEIKLSITSAGITQLEIYRFQNRLLMIMDVNEDFNAEKKAAMDNANEKVQEWERLMWKYQQPVPGAKEGEKWVLMHKIFEL
jgi:L-rhamnose mutarotase